MIKETFRQYIADADFKALFNALGWNRYPGITDFDEEIDGFTYHFRIVGQIKGFQAIVCDNAQHITNSICKRIDYKLRPWAQSYICIFVLPKEQYKFHHLWAIPIRKPEKRDIVLIEYSTPDQTELLFQKLNGITFSVNEQNTITITDVRERIYGAFEVNSEKLTKDFYTGFRKQHTAFCEFITGIDDQLAVAKNRNKQWYASVMLNRLMFCYFIQKKGFLDNNKNYLHEKLAWCQMKKGTGHFYSFYRSFLLQLFHGGLNSPKHNSEFEQEFGRIPYLNGGMFDVHQLERDYADIDIQDEAFDKLFKFFDQWEWHLDTRITASGRDINPDVLGYIFEQYINDRAEMGAYYTKEDITEYIGKNCILPFLMDKLKEQSPEAFKPDGYVWNTLRKSGSAYIYDAVKKGVDHWDEIPAEIAQGLDTTQPNLLERRAHWNDRTPETWALPTEIWRESIERMQRCKEIQAKITNGEITEINDFITYNLDIRQFVQDLLDKTDDHLFLLHFNKALIKVSILDPTCGSGAFLFAAMNILEPLYEACVNGMRRFNEQNPNLFKVELEELDSKYRSNVQYYIYKTIILNNLYGVDIMHEAVEIAKLRLFLKMVAVVDVDMRADNLGLDPLPDIDFNIRCGNTLVGYATEQQLENDLQYGDMFANLEFREKIETEMQKVSKTFDRFRTLQLTQTPDEMQNFKEAKKELNTRLATLNDLLNHKMYTAITAGGQPYEAWLDSHQPFHWLAEYYNIIHGNGGFDVIIGNPPYVGYTRKSKETGKAVCEIYKVRDYETLPTSNLYSFCIERSWTIMHKDAKIGMIIPISAFANDSMKELQVFFKTKINNLHVANFHQRPAQLFEGVLQRLSIFIGKKENNNGRIYTTGINRWYADTRNILFQNLSFATTLQDKQQHLVKIGGKLETSIFEKYSKQNKISQYLGDNNIHNSIFYRTAGGGYWVTFLYKEFDCVSVSNKHTSIKSEYNAKVFSAILNSNLFWWYYAINYDLFNFKDYMIFAFQFTYSNDDAKAIIEKSTSLETSLRKNAYYYVINSKTNGATQTVNYPKSQSKMEMDEIDKVLALHYGFTEEELDCIINYDIKYRMGDELNDE